MLATATAWRRQNKNYFRASHSNVQRSTILQPIHQACFCQTDVGSCVIYRKDNLFKFIFTIFSKNIFELTKESTAEDVIRAIKRAQNNHDHQDLKVIADFLINDCDVGFAYGYRGSLLARLAVAALHFGNNQVARRAIDIRRLEYRPSMLPMESAAIIRGLLRVHNATDALEILFDELSSPLEVSSHRIHQHIVLAVNTDFCLTPFTRGSI